VETPSQTSAPASTPEQAQSQPASARFEVTEFRVSPSVVEPDAEVTVAIRVANVGGDQGTYSLQVLIDGEAMEAKDIALRKDEAETHVLVVKRSEPGSYTVSVGNLSQTFEVIAVQEVTESSNARARSGGFSVALVGARREEANTYLWLSITKEAETDVGCQSLGVVLVDDHGNEYVDDLEIDLSGASDLALSALPIGFTYVDVVNIRIPKVAPIDSIRLGESEMRFEEREFATPQFLEVSGDAAVSTGQEVPVGEWLLFTLGPIEPGIGRWELPIHIQNKEYNPLEAEIEVGVQHEDGTISWRKSNADVEAVSEEVKTIPLPIASWVDGSPPRPRALLLLYCDVSGGEQALKISSMVPNALPALVGQGPEETERVFIEAYRRYGGEATMGHPSSPPHWFEGGAEPKDEMDILVQEFPETSESGPAAIIWDEQGAAAHAHVLQGAIWAEFSDLGGPYFESTVSGDHMGGPLGVTDEYAVFEGGTILASQGRSFFMETVFFEAYMRHGGSEVMGAPLDRPQWFDGGKVPSNSADLLIQEFPAVSDFGRAVIVWDKQDGASEAHVIHRDILDNYRSLGGPHSKLGAPVSDERTGRVPSSPRLEIGGMYNVFEGGIVALQQGIIKIFYTLPQEIWSFKTESYVFSSPAIASDGTIYVGSWDDKIYALNPDGSLKWAYKTWDHIDSSPAIGPDGTLYVGSGDKRIYALTPDGSLKWFFDTGGTVKSSPAIGPDGTIYVGSGYPRAGFRALNPDGTLKWFYKPRYFVYSSPAVSPDGTIYAGSGYAGRGEIFALDAHGSLKWAFDAVRVSSSPAIGSDGTIYVGSCDDMFYALNPDGNLKWAYETRGNIVSSPAIGPDGTIYVGSCDYKIYAFTPDGSLKWSFATQRAVCTSPAISSDGTIYAVSNDDRLYALNPAGSLKWSYETGGGFKCDIQSSPAIGPDGVIYVGSKDGRIHAIRDGNEGLADSSWPMFHHDPQHSGTR